MKGALKNPFSNLYRLEKSRPIQHSYDECHQIGSYEARIFQTETNIRYRKCSNPSHVVHLTSLSQHSIDSAHHRSRYMKAQYAMVV